MKIKFCALLAILMTALLLFTACGNGENKMRLTNNFIANNSKSLSTIITKEYDFQDFTKFFGQYSLNESVSFGLSDNENDLIISNVNQIFPIECLRYNEKIYYSVYRVKGGGYFYVFWVEPFNPFPNTESNKELGDPIVYFKAYISSLSKESDFDLIKEGISTAEDVAQCDPAFELSFIMSNGIYSYSLLDDGNVMQIEYTSNGEMKARSDLFVKNKTVITKEKAPSYLAKILPQDLPYSLYK